MILGDLPPAIVLQTDSQRRSRLFRQEDEGFYRNRNLSDIPISSIHTTSNATIDRAFTKPGLRHMPTQRPTITAHLVARSSELAVAKMIWRHHAPEAMPNIICPNRRPAKSCEWLGFLFMPAA